jgi:catechol 2,3-dioxygenase-like lactoylglutathione lyase family enzyme
MMARLDMVGIATRDMAASLEFYGLLGVDVPEGAGGEPHVEADLGGIRLAWDTIEVLEGVYGEWGEPAGHRLELAFACESRDDVDATHRRIVEGGHRSHREPWDAFWGQRYAVVLDPDGNLISLFA